ncbi:hypothetical protein HHI36_023823 [Cryptolaemus montrouzieri]|uniref:Uncharacterized protein n=1 Tax=Cryptolaemus montrouzieri TaxID=559131 RepID=A0ABD2PHQ5_9CUCU
MRSKKAGGAAHDAVDSIEIPEIKELSVEKHVEMVAVVLREQSLIVVSIKRSPKGNKDIFSDRFEKAMDWISTNGCVNTCVLGHFNFNFLRRSKNVTIVTGMMYSCGFSLAYRDKLDISNIRIRCWKTYEKFHSAIHASFNKSFPKVKKRMKTNQRTSRVSVRKVVVESAHAIYRVRAIKKEFGVEHNANRKSSLTADQLNDFFSDIEKVVGVEASPKKSIGLLRKKTVKWSNSMFNYPTTEEKLVDRRDNYTLVGGYAREIVEKGGVCTFARRGWDLQPILFESVEKNFEIVASKIKKKNLSKKNIHDNYFGDDINNLEQKERSNNLVITGIPKQKDEDVGKVVQKVLSTLKVTHSEEDIYKVYQIRKNEKAPIMLKLENHDMKLKTIKAVKQIKGAELLPDGIILKNRANFEANLREKESELSEKMEVPDTSQPLEKINEHFGEIGKFMNKDTYHQM